MPMNNTKNAVTVTLSGNLYEAKSKMLLKCRVDTEKDTKNGQAFYFIV